MARREPSGRWRTGVDTLVVDASREIDPFGVFLAPSGTGFIVRSASNRLFVDAANMENTRFTGSTGNDTIDTGTGETRVNGGEGTDHWIADLSAVRRTSRSSAPSSTGSTTTVSWSKASSA